MKRPARDPMAVLIAERARLEREIAERQAAVAELEGMRRGINLALKIIGQDDA